MALAVEFFAVVLEEAAKVVAATEEELDEGIVVG